MDEVLATIKKMLGIDISDTNFDDEIMIHINGALVTLSQVHSPTSTPLSIEETDTLWEDLFPSEPNLAMIRLYIYYKVRLGFDPPTVASLLDAFGKAVNELEFRLTLTPEEEEA